MIIAYRCPHCETILKKSEDDRDTEVIYSFIDKVCNPCKKLLMKLKKGGSSE